MLDKNIILFVNPVVNPESFEYTKQTIKSLKKYARENDLMFRYAAIYDDKKFKLDKDRYFVDSGIDIIIPCDLSDSLQIEGALLPYKDELLAITVRSPESNIAAFARIIPHVPYLKTPTAESLRWSTDKIKMREQLSLYDKTIVPPFTVVKNTTKKIVKEVHDKIGYPLVIKPANLALSLLVNLCFHNEELEKNLKKSFRKINKIYKENRREQSPKILVEHFMEGDMYSVDAYVDDLGRTYFCPLVYIETGRSIGFDDFFGYKMITPTSLTPESVKAAEEAAHKAIHAIGLKNSTAHIELIKADDGWKVIELGPRIGGFRHKMYKFSYGIDHQLNDVLIRIPKKPILPKKLRGYSAAMKFFARKEGVITEIKNIKTIQELKSFKEISQRYKVGDRATFAKNGGKPIFEVILFNKDRSDLLADIRRIEQAVDIKTKKGSG